MLFLSIFFIYTVTVPLYIIRIKTRQSVLIVITVKIFLLSVFHSSEKNGDIPDLFFSGIVALYTVGIKDLMLGVELAVKLLASLVISRNAMLVFLLVSLFSSFIFCLCFFLVIYQSI